MNEKCDKKRFVFQYGSNCLGSRLNDESKLGGAATPLGLATTVKKFDLLFTRKTDLGHAAADIVDRPATGRQICGVLYEIPQSRVFRNPKENAPTTLDKIEGEGTAYRRIEIDVIYKNEEKRALTYVVINKLCGIKTTCCYVKNIFDGLMEKKAPKEYLEYLKIQVEANNPDINAGKWIDGYK